MVMGRMRGKKVCGNAWEAIDLSTDHKPSTPEEYKRILKAGGCVDR
jgi:serine/threonine protein phosphatase PrpC